MLTNIAMILRPGDPQAIFQVVHGIVGNGPVLHLESRANQYLHRAGLPYECVQMDRHLLEGSPARLAQAARENLTAGLPVAMLVAASPLHWHWILALPGETDDAAFLIHDSWHARQVYRYTPDQGSRLMAVCLFRPRENP